MCKTKLIKDCKVGDTLYYVPNISFYNIQYGNNYIRTRSIEKIEYGCSWNGGDVYKIKEWGGLHNDDYHYEFKHISSNHDDLILDTDYASDSDGGKYFTTYEAARNELIHNLQLDVRKALEHLETAEMKYGEAKENFFIKRTKTIEINNRPYRKVEIYDINYFEHVNPGKLDKAQVCKKYNVYKRYISTNGLGRENYRSKDEYFVQGFDSLEEANAFIKENDKSYYRGESDWDFEGYRYYIKD